MSDVTFTRRKAAPALFLTLMLILTAPGCSDAAANDEGTSEDTEITASDIAVEGEAENTAVSASVPTLAEQASI